MTFKEGRYLLPSSIEIIHNNIIEIVRIFNLGNLDIVESLSLFLVHLCLYYNLLFAKISLIVRKKIDLFHCSQVDLIDSQGNIHLL